MNAHPSHPERTAYLDTAYLDTAGLGRMTDAVRNVLADCTVRDDRFGSYVLEEHLGEVLYSGIHRRLGELLGGVPAAGISLFTGAADAFDAFVSGLPLGPGDRIWATPHEGVAHLTTLYALRDRTRCTLEVVPLREDGDLDLDWMRQHLDADVALVSLVHVSSVCGTVNPVEAVGRLLAPHRARYAVDASYSAGQLPVDATRIGCDLLTADGWRFLRGPDGIGFAYATSALGEPLDAPDPHPAAVAALYEALDPAAAPAPAATGTPYAGLPSGLHAAVARTTGIDILTAGAERSGILSFRHPDIPAGLIRRGLARRGVLVRKAVAQETPLHPAGRNLTTAVSVSVHHDNTPEDIARFGHALQEVLREETRARRRTAAHPLPAAAAAAGAPALPAGARSHLSLVPRP
ncbi:aminotransferase class V-fold PLP-dependent enzyme [Streptomyces sp. NPDC002054]|uniref:aminotransferase class V-fold PLP-dependent enzyme n=1 Tax=Streptomyces sp. NPDC002054 TaxID=3154663 RepID=UPI0033213705